jgi:hypothetical protein
MRVRFPPPPPILFQDQKMKMLLPFVLVFGFILTAGPKAICAQRSDNGLHGALSAFAEFNDDEIKRLANGETVVKTIKRKNREEVAVIGVTRIDKLPAVSPERFRTSLSPEESMDVRSRGRFSLPPVADDVSNFRLEARDIDELRKCRVGNCDLNLSATAIRRFEAKVQDRPAEFTENAEQIFREMLIGHVASYLDRGDSGLGEYSNRRKVVDLSNTHRELLSASGILKELAPGFYRYLEQFPRSSAIEPESGLFWSTTEFGFRPMMTVSHIMWTEEESAHGKVLALATKQIYSTRYLDASLSFAVLLKGKDNDEAYLIVSNRSRSDVFSGLLGGIARTGVEGEAVDRVGKLLESASVRLVQEESLTTAGTDQDSSSIGSGNDGVLSRYRLLVIAGLLAALGLGSWLIWRKR